MEQNINCLEFLPAIPVAARLILRELNSESADLSKICSAIELDPGSVARLIGVANSAFYAGHKEITSVKEAVMRLGMEETRRLVLAIALSKTFDWSACGSFNASWYWEDALNIAFCSDRLARGLPGFPYTGAAYAAGLLHNIGILVLVHLYPHKMAYVCNRVTRLVFGHVISRYMDFDHRQAGAMLLKAWELPEPFIAVTENLSKSYQGKHEPLVHLVQFAVQWYNFRYAVVPEFAAYQALHFDKQHLRQTAVACKAQKEKNEQFAAMLVYA